MNVTVPTGISGQSAKHSSSLDSQYMANELALISLGDIVPLNQKINCAEFMQDIAQFDNDWVDYLPRTDRPNNRQSLAVTNLPGKDHRNNPSLAQASYAAGRRLSENEFNTPTDVFNNCPSISGFLNTWMPLGRTFLVKSNVGGYFVPHRDHPAMPRQTFRLIAFLNNCGPHDYDWLMGNNKMQIEPGRVYYVNTRLEHRTISWVNDSIHLILNVPMTTENVAKVIANLLHTH